MKNSSHFFHSRYVQEDLLKPGDIHYKQFHKIFEMFKLTEGSDGSAKTTPTNQLDVDDESMSIAAKSSAAQKKQRDEEESEDEVREGERKVNPRQLISLANVWCTVHILFYVQWNLSNQDTIRADLNVLNREVFLIQRLLSTQMWHLGQVKVSCL